MRVRIHTRLLLLLGGFAAAAVAASLAAGAGTSTTRERFAFVPVSGQPLKSGYADIAHPNTPKVYAHHRYVLKGAGSDQAYQVVISIWTANLTCSGPSTFDLPTAVLLTDRKGNGRAEDRFPPALVAGSGCRG